MLKTWLKRKTSARRPNLPCTCYQLEDDRKEEDNESVVQPPPPEGGNSKPILLPNELLLQTFTGKRSMYKVSKYRVQTSQFECHVHDHNETDICEEDVINENDIEYLTVGAQPGSIYITTERVVFVPVQASQRGFSIQIENITSMKVVGSSDSIFDAWFFVCYVGKYMSTIPFTSRARAQSFLKLISNIRFEHNVKSCLPPKYDENIVSRSNIDPVEEANNTRATAVLWAQEDTRLPTYDESEHALKLFLVSKGLLQIDQPFDHNGDGENARGNLIELASAPPRTPDPETRLTEILGQAEAPNEGECLAP